MLLSEIVKEYRLKHSLSTRDFAARCGLSHGYINMIEQGENPATNKPISPSIEKLEKIAKGLGISMHELFEQMDDTVISLDEPKWDYDETRIILAYRDAPENVKVAIRALLGV